MSAPVIVWMRPGVGYVADAAASMRRLEAALGRPHDCNSSYRDYNKQMSMWRAWQAYEAGNAPHPGHSRALHPDASMHCKGLADDSDDWTTPGYIALAADHGWIRTAANDPTERHHFEYQAWRDNHRYEGVPSGTEEEMANSDEILTSIRETYNRQEAINARDEQRHGETRGLVSQALGSIRETYNRQEQINARDEQRHAETRTMIAALTEAVKVASGGELSAEGMQKIVDAAQTAAREGAQSAVAAAHEAEMAELRGIAQEQIDARDRDLAALRAQLEAFEKNA